MSDVYRPPASDLGRQTTTGQSVEAALRGDFQFDVFDVLGEAWRRTKGIKRIVLLGVVLMFVAVILVQLVTQAIFGGGLFGLFVSTLLQIMVYAPFFAGLLYAGIHHAVEHRVSFDDVFGQFPRAGVIIGFTLVQSVLIYVGFLLLVLPGIYLSIAYMLALPLLLDRNLGIWEALETSRKALTKCWWRMFFVMLLMSLIVAVSVLPLGIGLIWTIPMWVMVIGVAYRQIFGVATAR